MSTDAFAADSAGGQNEPAWIAAARGARYMNDEQVNQAAAELHKLPADAAQRANTLLNEVAASAGSASGLREAGAKLDAALGGFVAGGPKRPGQDPNQGRLLRAALAVFHGRVNALAKKIAGEKNNAAAAAELLRAIKAAKPSLRGVHAALALEEEARIGLGHALFESAKAAAFEAKP